MRKSWLNGWFVAGQSHKPRRRPIHTNCNNSKPDPCNRAPTPQEEKGKSSPLIREFSLFFTPKKNKTTSIILLLLLPPLLSSSPSLTLFCFYLICPFRYSWRISRFLFDFIILLPFCRILFWNQHENGFFLRQHNHFWKGLTIKVCHAKLLSLKISSHFLFWFLAIWDLFENLKLGGFFISGLRTHYCSCVACACACCWGMWRILCVQINWVLCFVDCSTD